MAWSRRAAVLALLGAWVAGVAPVANAATSGVLRLAPPKGTLDTPMYVSSSGPCSGGDYFHIFVTGAALSSPNNVITGATELAGLPRATDRSLYAPLSSTLRDFFDAHHVTSPHGRYRVTLRCRAALDLTSLGDFSGDVDIAADGHYAAVGPAALPVTKPNGGGPLGPNSDIGGSASGGPSAPAGKSLQTAPTDRATSSTTQPFRVNGALVGGLALLVLILAGLMFAVSRRRPRADIRPGAIVEQRKVNH